MRVRPSLGERADAHRARRRDFARLLPAVGRRDAEQARQGPLPPRYGRPGRGLSGGRAQARTACRQSDAGENGPSAGALEIGPKLMKARITITLKPGVLDPQGKAIEGALKSLGITGVASVRQGKVFDIELDGRDRKQAQAALKQAADRLLANTLIENYDVKLL